MGDRIGAFHVHYRIPGGSPMCAVRAGAVDRALQRGIAEALTARLASRFGAESTVSVVRNVSASIALRGIDALSDTSLIDRVSSGAVDAIAQRLARPESSHDVVRFTNETEFIGSFIADLLRGVAWERWYYGAFRQYRRAEPAATLRALLEDHSGDVDHLLDWLKRHGHLGQVRKLLGEHAEQPRWTATSAPDSVMHRREGLVALAEAAMELLRLLGHELFSSGERDRLITRFTEGRRTPPAWTDQRDLSLWVLEWLQFVRAQMPPSRQEQAAPDHAGIRAVLSGPLDWLDGPWLADQLGLPPAPEVGAPRASAAPSARRSLIARQERVLAQLAASVRSGAMRVTREGGANRLVEQLLTAATHETDAQRLDGALVAVLTAVARAYFELSSGVSAPISRQPDTGPAAASGGALAMPDDSDHRLASLREVSPAALELLKVMLAVTPDTAVSGEPTRGAGLYLLVRALQDLRVPGLARAHGISLTPLFAGLACKWLGLQPPFDPATALWVGSERPEPRLLEIAPGSLAELNLALTRALIDHGTPDAQASGAVIERDVSSFADLAELSAAADRELGRTASLVLRGWARWLPGLRDASARFHIERCLRREAHALVTPRSVDLTLAPAPMDIVIEMAGYFRPIESVPWLGDRSIRFIVGRGSAAAHP